MSAERSPVPVNEPLLDGNELAYLRTCIETGWISSDGPFVAELESRLAKRVGRRFGVAFCNGTAALEVALVGLDLEPGSEVILPSFTIISCVAAVLRAGLTPVLVDSDPVTWNMSPGDVAAKISPRTRAMMVVHIYGLPADMAPLLALAEEHELQVIEDAAEQLGQTYEGAPCGSFGRVSGFSFYANKHVTTGEGGMLVTDDERLAERYRSLRNLCFQPERRFVHEELGYNFRLSNLHAAVGLAQLERLDAFLEKKRWMGAAYRSLLAEHVEHFDTQPASTPYARNVYWVYGLVLKQRFPRDAAWFMKGLAKLGIGTRPFFFPMHEQPVFRKMGLFAGDRLPVSENLARRGLYLPSGLGLTEEQLVRTVRAVEQVLREGL